MYNETWGLVNKAVKSMNLQHITYKGPDADDREILSLIPENLASLLSQINGFVQYHGGFHLFGACYKPTWHSLRELWQGDSAAWRHYDSICETDVPFAEDCLGFQFFLRDGRVITLDGETGYLEELHMGLAEFFDWIAENPSENLGMQPLLQFMEDGGLCEPGELIAEYPFFCTIEAENGVHFDKVPAMERRVFLADLHRQLSDIEEGKIFDVIIK